MFACKPGGPHTGRPLHAAHCRCERPAFIDDTCVLCGRRPEKVVRDTFARQSRGQLDPRTVRVLGNKMTPSDRIALANTVGRLRNAA